MLNNTMLKRFLKATIFKPLNVINKIIPKDDSVVLLYSGNLGIGHNLKPLKKYLINNNYNQKYKIVCGIESMKYADKPEKNVVYITHFKSVWYFMKAKHVFYTAGQIPIKPSAEQIVIHMNHGTSDLKSCGALTNINNGDEFFFTYMLAPSPLYVPIFAKEYLCPEKNILVCGEPMTDDLINKKCHYELGEFEKIILWLPTFRQSEYLNYNDSSAELLPMFTIEDYEELNSVLKSYNFKLIVKLHTAQNLQEYSKLKYSNLDIYSNDVFVKNNYDLYELMPQVDALLGDYSSASLQFLLLDKPLAFVVPDMEEYRKNRGFCFENPEEYMPGPLIKNKKQLYAFFNLLKSNTDPYIKERKRVRDLIFQYQDGNNCERVLKIGKIYK